MRALLLSSFAAAALAFGTAGAIAQTPVPNASGSQVTSPGTYRATAYQNRAQHPTMKRHAATTKKHHAASKKHHMTRHGHEVTTTGSVHRAVPVPNASGSQVTSPGTYGASAYQYRR